MYLKRLDLQGFKSFPEKVKLEFNPGVTAVVGPNGSGKSNVSDAVRWVLGEQRARSLRGDKMEDIIFAGTENRKPLGFAEVSILLDNQDGRLPLAYSEVQVTRRVFRSGESEYRINGTACRLKDIQELFMDTGVGREGYSIIGQGRIDEILSAKGEERRRIFEEAAGIVKYKTRKNEAVNKLEKEQQNLLRVDDIISELEVQVEPLEKQSEKAREYLRLKERLKQMAGTLSGGEQQMLAMGRALMCKPKMLLLDEPSMGLSPLLVKEIFKIIRQVNRNGVTVLLVEQNANMALKIADLAYVLETGTITMSGTGAELLADSRVKEAYLGRSN